MAKAVVVCHPTRKSDVPGDRIRPRDTGDREGQLEDLQQDQRILFGRHLSIWTTSVADGLRYKEEV